MDVASIVTIVIVGIAALFLFRAIALWYWKVNQLLASLDAIRTDVANIARHVSGRPAWDSSTTETPPARPTA